jgi:hypothetical protein
MRDALELDITTHFGVVIGLNGMPFCHVCGKEGFAHLVSAQHLRNIDEVQLGNAIAGPALTTRRLTNGKMNQGLEVGKLTKFRATQYWGACLDRTAALGWARIHVVGGIYLNNSFWIPVAMIRGVTLKLVTYSGQGKYHAGTQIVSFTQLPDCDRLFDEWVSNGWTPPTNAPGEGWWPVLSIETPTGWLETMGRTSPGGSELVVCFYQLQGGRIVGWWIDAEDMTAALSW